MSEILHLELDTSATRTLRRPEAVLDPATAAVVDTAVAAARDEAHAQGREAGRREAAASLGQAATAVTGAIAALHEELRTQRDAATAASLDVARAAAGAVLGRTPPDDALEVLERVRAACALLDAEVLEVRLHPEDHAAIGELADDVVRLVADAAVAPGEARIDGAFCSTDLRRAALLEAALTVLGEGSA